MRSSKLTRRALLTSAVSMVLCGGLLLGTTLAWFTDSAKNTGNRIQAGELSVDLLLHKENEDYVSIADGTGDIFSDAEGGNGVLWEPGKTEIVYLAVQNTASLALNYQFVLNVTDGTPGLVGSLDYAVLNGTKYGDLANVGTWEELKTKAEADMPTSGTTGAVAAGTTNFTPGRVLKPNETAYFAMAVHMREEASNQYQGGSITIDVNLLAKQATYEQDGFGSDQYDKDAQFPSLPVGGTTEALKEALAAAKPGDTLELAPATYVLDEALVIPSGVTIRGAQAGKAASEWVNDDDAEKTVIQAPETGDRVLKIEQNAGETVQDVVLDGILIDGNEKDVKGIYVKKNDGSAMTGIVIRNCAVVDCGNDGIDVGNTDGAIIENNYVSGIYDNGIQLTSYNNADGNTAYIRNNVVENVGGDNGGTINGAIAVSGGKGDVVVTGNTVSHVRSADQVALPNVDMGESAIVVESVYEGGVITIEKNTLQDVSQGIAVYKFSAAAEGDKVVIRENTINEAGKFNVATSTLNYQNTGATAVVEILNNQWTNTAEPSKGALYIERINRYNETTSGWQVTATGNTSGNETYTG